MAGAALAVSIVALVVAVASAVYTRQTARAETRSADVVERHQRFRQRLLLVTLAPLVLAERPLPFELFQRAA